MWWNDTHADGIEPILLGTIFIEHAEIHEKLADALLAQRDGLCRAKPNEHNCSELHTIEEKCQLWNDRLVTLEQGRRFYEVKNHAQSKCDFLRFQSLILMLRLSGYSSDLGFERFPITAEQKKAAAEQKDVPAENGRPVLAIRFQNAGVQRKYEDIEQELKPIKRPIERHAIKFLLRSPRQLLGYLGALISLQNFSQDHYVPKVLARSGQTITVFHVVHGNSGAEPTALAVKDPYGDTYFVPRPAYGSSERDQTLRILSIAGELVNGAISEKDFPVPATVAVRAIQ